MTGSFPIVLAAILFSVSAMAQPADDRLIGGVVATEDAAILPATVKIFGLCTAAKVAPRKFLTAAHCFYKSSDGSMRDIARPGARALITTRKRPEQIARDWTALNVTRVDLEPGYATAYDACSTKSCRNGVSYYSSDVAVLTVSESTPNIPTATVDYAYVQPQTAVTLTGYGCEDGVHDETPSSFYDGRFKYQPAAAQFQEALAHDGFDWSWSTSVFSRYVITPGRGWTLANASLCPGDSGGPLYIRGTNRIVGVNAYYSFNRGDQQGISRTNWHTRLSAVSSWLRSTLSH